MKKIQLLIVALMLTIIAFQSQQIVAQSPEKMSYQAVVRDANNDLIINQSAGMRISILQGSTSGTSVYSETQNPTTNANGLVSIEIGTGTTSDDFSTVDWANGPYFIKTETDPTGGTNYSITGTSQLMSVPYALHAKTAGSVAGGILESDPVFKKSFAFGISQKDTAKWNDHTQINSKSIAKLGFALGAHRDSTDIASMGFVAGSGSSTYSVGDFALGGIVFWVDESGQHGLVCAKEDQSSDIQWYNSGNSNTEALGDGIGAGEMNTMLIIANQGSSSNSYAAGICANLVITVNGNKYGDWYLPSMEELNLMNQNKSTIDATATANGGTAFATDNLYWSSTEFHIAAARCLSFNTGETLALKLGTFYVRSVRAF